MVLLWMDASAHMQAPRCAESDGKTDVNSKLDSSLQTARRVLRHASLHRIWST
jgi:hypothetical protein